MTEDPVGGSDSTDSDGSVEWINSIKPGNQIRCRFKVHTQDVTHDVVFQVDTGATTNTLPQKYAPLELMPTDKTVVMWNDTSVEPLGKCRLKVRNPSNNKQYNIQFLVVDNDHTPLIGLTAAQRMGLVTIEEQNMERILAVSSNIVEDHATVFDGQLGILPGKTSIKVKEDATPVVMLYRRTPISLRLYLLG